MISIQADCLKQRCQFALSQITPLTQRKPCDTDWTDSHAAKPVHCNSGGIHHIADDVIGPFMDNHFEDEPIARLTENAKLLRNDAMPLDNNPRAHLLHHVVAWSSRSNDVVLLLQLVARVHHPIGDIAIVGEEQQAFGITIETTNRINALRDMDQIHHGPAVSLVFGCGDISTRFIENQIARTLRPDKIAIDANH